MKKYVKIPGISLRKINKAMKILAEDKEPRNFKQMADITFKTNLKIHGIKKLKKLLT